VKSVGAKWEVQQGKFLKEICNSIGTAVFEGHSSPEEARNDVPIGS
jgi:hypothetical protein